MLALQSHQLCEKGSVAEEDRVQKCKGPAQVTCMNEAKQAFLPQSLWPPTPTLQEEAQVAGPRNPNWTAPCCICEK